MNILHLIVISPLLYIFFEFCSFLKALRMFYLFFLIPPPIFQSHSTFIYIYRLHNVDAAVHVNQLCFLGFGKRG